MEERELIRQMHETSKQMILTMHAHKMANMCAFEALLQSVEQASGRSIRPAIIRALEGYQQSAALTSDDEGDFRQMVAESFETWIEHLSQE